MQAPTDHDPDGPHRADILAQLKPYLDAELVDALVVGIYDGGRREIYGVARPGSPVPNGKTLFELGDVTRVYTGLLFADGIERKEIDADTLLADAVPPGVTVPTQDNQTIRLRDLALNASGLPRLPPHVDLDNPDPYAPYNEDVLYADLVAARLARTPETAIIQSTWGYGVLGVALGRKLDGGTGYAKLVRERILDPLEMHDTFVGVPDAARSRLVRTTDDDLQPTTPWHWAAMAGAGGMVADARDLLALIDVELDAADGSKRPLRAAMHFTQVPALDQKGPNTGIGWQIDESGRYWQNGTTRGCHAFVGFDPKTRAGVVVLAATGLAGPVDGISEALYGVIANHPPAPAVFPTIDKLQPVVGTYELSGTRLQVVARGNRLYLVGPGEAPMRVVPFTDRLLWIERLQAAVGFERGTDGIKAMMFASAGKQMSAARVPDAPTRPPAGSAADRPKP